MTERTLYIKTMSGHEIQADLSDEYNKHWIPEYVRIGKRIFKKYDHDRYSEVNPAYIYDLGKVE